MAHDIRQNGENWELWHIDDDSKAEELLETYEPPDAKREAQADMRDARLHERLDKMEAKQDAKAELPEPEKVPEPTPVPTPSNGPEPPPEKSKEPDPIEADPPKKKRWIVGKEG